MVATVSYYALNYALERTVTSLTAPVVMMLDVLEDGEGVVEYMPLRRGFCPGEAIGWSPVKTALQDADVTIWRTVRRLDESGMMHVMDFNISHFSLEAGDVLTDAQEYVVGDFPPGCCYYILNSIHVSGSRVVRYRVPFVVRGDC
jgi:hypothetical protein